MVFDNFGTPGDRYLASEYIDVSGSMFQKYPFAIETRMTPHSGETANQALWLRGDTPGHCWGGSFVHVSIRQLQHEVNSVEV